MQIKRQQIHNTTKYIWRITSRSSVERNKYFQYLPVLAHLCSPDSKWCMTFGLWRVCVCVCVSVCVCQTCMSRRSICMCVCEREKCVIPHIAWGFCFVHADTKLCVSLACMRVCEEGFFVCVHVCDSRLCIKMYSVSSAGVWGVSVYIHSQK